MTIIAYILSPICSIIAWFIGGVIGHFTITYLFYFLPIRLRFKISSFSGGFFSVCLAIVAVWFLFYSITGNKNLPIGAFLLSIFPILLTIPGELKNAKISSDAFKNGEPEFVYKDNLHPEDDMSTAFSKISVLGTMFGLLVVVIWKIILS